MKEEALKLADELDKLHQYVPSEAPAMIRRLVEELDKQEMETARVRLQFVSVANIKPLSDEEIEQLAKRKANQILMDLLMPDVGEPKKIDWNIGCTNQHLVNFARAIEERHGIK